MAKASHSTETTLDRSPSHLLHRALQLALDIYADETGPGAITQRQFAVLTAVAAKEGCTQSDLVRSTSIDRSTLAELVARLITKGLLARERSATDARANVVRLTAEGRSVMDGAAPKVAAADDRILALMPAGKRATFLKTLRDMAKGEGKAPLKDKASRAEKVAKAERKKLKKAAKKAKKAETLVAV